MSLELLIYLIDVAGRAGFVAEVSAVIGGIGLCISLVAGTTEDFRDHLDYVGFVRWYKRAAVAWAAMVVIAVFAPSKTAMYAIAAVSMSREAVATDIGQRVIKAAEKWALEKLEAKE